MIKKIFGCFLCLLITIPGITATQVQHPWQGKRVAYLGDSITDPKNKAAKKHYWAYLQEMLGITPYVYAVSGRQWNDIPRQAEQLKKEHGNDFDAIMVFIGTNDYNAGVPIGEWFTATLDNFDPDDTLEDLNIHPIKFEQIDNISLDRMIKIINKDKKK